MQLQYGSYVLYKNNPYIAVGNDGRGSCKILDPHSNKKLQVKTSNIKLCASKCREVMHKGTGYLVTLGKTPLIISSISLRVVWKDDCKVRSEILGDTPRF